MPDDDVIRYTDARVAAAELAGAADFDVDTPEGIERLADAMLAAHGCRECGVIVLAGDPYVCEHGVTAAPVLSVEVTGTIGLTHDDYVAWMARAAAFRARWADRG